MMWICVLEYGEKGHLIVYDPYVELYHYESKTRGAEDTKEKSAQISGRDRIYAQPLDWHIENGDPAYNPNLSLKKWDYSLKVN